jgi:hypothetical protein
MEIQASKPMAQIEAATRARAAAAAQAADRSQQYRSEQDRLQAQRTQEQVEDRRQHESVMNAQGQTTGRIVNETA